MANPGIPTALSEAKKPTEWPKPKHARMAREANRIRAKFFSDIMRGEKGVAK